MRQPSNKHVTSGKQTDNEFVSCVLRESLGKCTSLDHALIKLVQPNAVWNHAC